MKPEKKISENPDWDRLHEVIRQSGMSINAFALHIGLPRSENLYQIKKGNHGISKALAETINRFYPKYTVGWLLSGESSGTKFTPEMDKIEIQARTLHRIPVYGHWKENAKPLYHTYLPEDIINEASYAIFNKDESLSSKIPLGALLLVKPTDGNIVFGKYYLIVTHDYTVIRKIRLTVTDENYRLVCDDAGNYDEITIPKNKIEAIHAIVKVISDNW